MCCSVIMALCGLLGLYISQPINHQIGGENKALCDGNLDQYYYSAIINLAIITIYVKIVRSIIHWVADSQKRTTGTLCIFYIKAYGIMIVGAINIFTSERYLWEGCLFTMTEVQAEITAGSQWLCTLLTCNI